MKTMKRLILLLAIFAPLTTSTVFAFGETLSPEATEEIRLVAAKEKLSKESNAVVLYAKGLCCPSCAIGIRKMISKLGFVDHSRFNKGVDLDAKTQLVSVAIDETKKVNFKSLSQAVKTAGYDPVRAYELKDGKVLVETLVTEELK